MNQLCKNPPASSDEKGGRTSHASIIARELNKPAIVGVRNALHTFHDGQLVTIDCTQGDIGYIYDGHIPFEEKRSPIG